MPLPVAPLRRFAMAATMAMSIFKVVCVSVVMGLCAWLFYDYNIFVIGLWLLPFVLSLVITGWVIGVFTTSLIMRFGQEAEVLPLAKRCAQRCS